MVLLIFENVKFNRSRFQLFFPFQLILCSMCNVDQFWVQRLEFAVHRFAFHGKMKNFTRSNIQKNVFDKTQQNLQLK